MKKILSLNSRCKSLLDTGGHSRGERCSLYFFALSQVNLGIECSCLFSDTYYFFTDLHISKIIVTTIAPFLLLSTVPMFATINDTMLIACPKACNNADSFIWELFMSNSHQKTFLSPLDFAAV